MRRYAGQKALYEAIARTKAKSQRRGILDLLHPGNSRVEQEEPASAPTVVEELPKIVEEPKPVAEPVKLRIEPMHPRVEPVRPPESNPVYKPPVVEEKPVKTAEPVNPRRRPLQNWLKPKAVQVHDGRIEVSLPYTVGVTVLLGAMLLVLGAFRLGQRWSAAPTTPAAAAPAGAVKMPVKTTPPVAARETPAPQPEAPVPTTTPAGVLPAAPAAATPTQGGDHAIVLAQYSRFEDLVPVQEYFRQKGVETKIYEIKDLRDYLLGQRINAAGLDGSGFILMTADFYMNPQNQGTDGYAALMKIRELGRGYKAPAGKESFAPRYFSDAYGRRVK